MRIVTAALAVAVVAAPSPALAARLPVCVSYADAKGDSGPQGVTALNDATLDVTKVRLSAVGGAWVAQVTVAAFAERPTAAPGSRYEVHFTVGGKAVEVYWKTSPTRDEEANAYRQQGVYVDGELQHDAVTGTVAKNVVSISVKLNMLSSALGFRVNGLRASNVRALAFASYVGAKREWDVAAGPATGFVVGQACR